MGKSKEIIESFISGRKSLHTGNLFMRWLSSSVNEEEKDKALSEIWDTSEPYSMHTERALRKTKSRLFGESPAYMKKFKRRIAVAAVMIPVLSAGAALLYTHEFIKDNDVAMSELYVPYCSVETIVLPDGSKVTANSGSLLVYPDKFTGEERQVFLSGEACFDVAENEDMPFVVNTKDFDVEVLGTVFNVSSYPDDSFSSVVLKEGSVRLIPSDATEDPVVIGVNQSIRYDRIGDVYTVDNVSADNYLCWRQNGLYFHGQTLEDIIKVAERRYDVKISSLNPDKFSSARITAKFIHEESLEDFLNVLQKLIPEMSYTIGTNGKYVYIQ